MPTKKEAWLFLFGTTIGFCFAGSLFWTLQSSSLSGFVYSWQTLITGVMALIGAGLTVMVVLRQIDQATKQAELERSREEQAAKAVLPLALSALNQYAQQCIVLIDRQRPFGESPIAISPTLSAPSIPTEGIAILRACARYAMPDVVFLISTLLGKLQVQHSRLQSLIDGRRNQILQEQEANFSLKDAADIYAAVNLLYEYGRDDEAIRKRAPLDKLESALRVSGIWDKKHPVFAYLSKDP